jgi:tRNA(Ile)-lysidine synthase
MQPLGAPNPIKLKSLFSAAHIPSADRRDKLVVETAKAIVWVEGLRIAEPCKVTPETRQMLLLRLKSPSKPLHTR